MRRVSFFGDPITLKPDEFRLLRDLFAARTGLHFGPESRFTLERRLRERLLVLKRWLGAGEADGSALWHAVDAQLLATMRTCGLLTGSFGYGEMKRHRAWVERCRLF